MKRVPTLAPVLALLACLLLACLLLPGALLAAATTIDAAPAEVAVGAFYNGATLNIEGSVPEGAQVVLRLSGAPAEVSMKKKGKAFGLLWMNMDTVHFSGAPTVFLAQSSAPLEDLGQAGEALGIGEKSALVEAIHIGPEGADRAALMPEFLKLKAHEGLYRAVAEGLTLAPAQNGSQKFRASFRLPSRLSPGAYTLEAVAVKDGAEISRASRGVEVKLAGMPAVMADLAFNHGLWYGVLSSVIAILAGLGIGLVFQSKGAH